MGKLVKILGAIIGLLLIIVIVAPMVIDPNDYRDQIKAAVKEQTGRELSINGDLKLSVFPWLGVSINQVSLSNATNFKADHFAKIDLAEVNVKLLPLLSQQVEVSTVVLKGVSINLEKNNQGVTNWQDMAGDASSGESASSSSDSSAAAAIAVGGLQIEDANVSWDDRSKGETYRLMNMNLTTDALSLGQAMGVQLAFTVDSAKPKVTARFDLKGDLVIDSSLEKFDFKGLAMTIDTAGEPIPNGTMRVEINSDIMVNLAGAGQAALNPVTIKFDDSTLNGQASVSNFSTPAIRFDLNLDNINVDRYLPQTAEGERSDVAAAPPAAAALLPVETIRALDIDGSFKIQNAIVSGLTAKNASVKVKAKNGLVNSNQAVESFYNGTYAGTTVIDARGATPQIKIKEEASGIDIEPLLADLTGDAQVSGQANLKADLTTRGNSIEAFKSGLNGRMNFSFKDGALLGMDVGALMNQAEGILAGNPAAVLEQGSGKTPFTDLSGSATVTNGLVKNNDLLATSPVLNLTGAGEANLVNEQLDYTLKVQRTKALSVDEVNQKDDLKNIEIPITVGGTFTEPKIGVDAKALLIASQKGKIEEKKEELKEKINEKIGDKAGELLKGLF